mgnify:FL=1
MNICKYIKSFFDTNQKITLKQKIKVVSSTHKTKVVQRVLKTNVNPYTVINSMVNEIRENYKKSNEKAIYLSIKESTYFLGNPYIRNEIKLLGKYLNCELNVYFYHYSNINYNNDRNQKCCSRKLYVLDPNLNLQIFNSLLNIKYKNMNDVGHLKYLRTLIIDKFVEGIHLLDKLEELDIICYHPLAKNKKKKFNARIKKLKQINPDVKITFMHSCVN